ncbi:complement component C1q receptor [Puntigrus tetrazona]|uniref:complement component C1q receptor n=1 Tax=Puntigrus tetrazona TaxID=1606681 RepID=UPI001C8A824B|nr:complement component C1q receptor [Puntigrus tetrazona]
MMLALILALSCFVADGTDRVITTCTAEACLTLHLEEKRFKNASDDCVNNGGKLVTMRNEDELQSIKSALSGAGGFSVHSKLWIGLALQKRRCTDFTEELHGFRWTSEPADSKYSYWKKKPLGTCTEKRCVSISLADGLKWTDSSCRDSAFFMCKFLFKGMCKPMALEGPGDVKYNVPFLSEPLTRNERLAMLPHGTGAEVLCGGSEDAEFFFSLCDSKDGVFGWTNSESFCARRKSCKRRNGGCEHRCSETGAGVRCECRDGYYLKDDKASCALRNSCENSPCASKCVPTAAGFACACAEGFDLAEDGVGCVDVDECRRATCGEQRCRNTPGSYFCECEPGFRLVAGKCEDVDECTEGRCEQGCLNSQGSFSCYCHAGYSSTLNDSRRCVDIDECVGRPCEDLCLNTLGSFKCACRENFILAKNGIGCVPGPTEKPLNSPPSGRREAFATKPSRLPGTSGPTTASPLAFTNAKTDSSKHQESFLGGSWVLACVVGSVVPLVAVIVVISVFVVYRWKRARKAALKNATADNYCWVSSGLDKERKNAFN